MSGQCWIGTSGWVYKHWKNLFYPEDLAQHRYLQYYSQHFDTVELNYSFYRLPTRHAFENWRDATPRDFLFAVKASRYLTHVRRLREPAEPLQRLVEAAGGLGGKLAVFLFQFPPYWQKDIVRLEAFLEVLPRAYRAAFEFRHPSWLSEDVYRALRRKDCALCIPDRCDSATRVEVTAHFTYLRFHSGCDEGNYRFVELRRWAEQVSTLLERGIDVYAYFNNDVAAYAVRNAMVLKELLLKTPLPNPKQANPRG